MPYGCGMEREPSDPGPARRGAARAKRGRSSYETDGGSRGNGWPAPKSTPRAASPKRSRKRASPEVDSTDAELFSPTDSPASLATPRRKSPTPPGKVKASFNLLYEDIESLRTMAGRLGTTVTNVLQRAIRDERFVQDQLAKGNRFAVVDQEGSVREIIWR